MPSGGAHPGMRGFNADEDQTLNSLYDQHGPRWKLIAAEMSDAQGVRTAAMVRNRWLRVQRGKKRAAEGLARNKCGQCGMIKQGHICTAVRSVIPTSIDAQQAAHREARLFSSGASASDMSLPPIASSVLGDPDGLRLGSPPALTFDDAVMLGQENRNGSQNKLQLLAPPVGCGDAARGAPPIAASFIFSGDASPAVAPSPGEGFLSAASLAASLLAPTPEGGMFSFPTPPPAANLQATPPAEPLPAAEAAVGEADGAPLAMVELTA